MIPHDSPRFAIPAPRNLSKNRGLDCNFVTVIVPSFMRRGFQIGKMNRWPQLCVECIHEYSNEQTIDHQGIRS